MKYSKEKEEKLIRECIYVKALTVLEHWGVCLSEAYLAGIKDTLRIFLDASTEEIKALEKKIDKRVWSKKEISKDVKKVINLYLEERQESKEQLKRWRNGELNLFDITCDTDVFEKSTRQKK